MIHLSTPTLAVAVNERRGAEIHQITANGRHALLWSDDSADPLPSGESTTYGSSSMDWLSHYRGGWQGLFPNAGADSEALGVPLPFHGETSTAAWTVVRSDDRSVTLETPSRLPLVIRRTIELSPDRPHLTVSERVENTSGLTVPFVWGHHPAWLAEPGTRVDVPPSRVVADPGFDTDLNDLPPGLTAAWPTVQGKGGRSVDLSTVAEGDVERLARLHDLSAGWYGLRRESAGFGVCVSWDIKTFPWLWYWVEIGGTGFPWYGRARIVALEPVNTSQGGGLAAARAIGEGAELAPRGVRETALHLTVFETRGRPVTGVSDAGEALFE